MTVAISQQAGEAKPPMTLEAVRAVIPEQCYERSTVRSTIVVLRSLTTYLVVLWGLWSTDKIWFVVPLWLLASFSLASLFVLGHDAAHGALFNSRWANGVVGRILMLPSLHVFESWVLGHNRIHHGHTARQDMDFVWHPLTAAEYAAMAPHKRLRHRLEWSSIGSGAYYARAVWWRKMIRFRPPEKFAKRIWRDWWLVVITALVVGGLFCTVGWLRHDGILGGAWVVAKLFAVPTLGFMHIIGWTVYVHHVARDVRWWPRREWTKYRGQIESTTILHAPRWINRIWFHNIFVHVPHHVDMRIPFYHLTQAARAIAREFSGIVERPLRLRHYFANARKCKLYDFEAGRWMTYREARVAVASVAAKN